MYVNRSGTWLLELLGLALLRTSKILIMAGHAPVQWHQCTTGDCKLSVLQGPFAVYPLCVDMDEAILCWYPCDLFELGWSCQQRSHCTHQCHYTIWEILLQDIFQKLHMNLNIKECRHSKCELDDDCTRGEPSKSHEDMTAVNAMLRWPCAWRTCVLTSQNMVP